MTSNQLANAANLENQRHNTTTEAETTRHNVVMEQLEAQRMSIEEDRNAINRDIAEYTKTIESEKNMIQRQYNEWYMKWTEANEDRKRVIENTLATLKQREVDLDATYKQRMTDLQAQKNDIEARAQEVEASWKSFQKSQSLATYTTDTLLREKELELRANQISSQSAYWAGALANERTRMSNEWTLGIANAAIKQQSNALTALDLVYQAQLKNKKFKLDVFDSVSSMLLKSAETTIRGLNMHKLGVGNE